MDQDEQCCICLEIINYARGVKLLESSCRHKFCEKCKNKLFQKRNDQDCPICRKKIYKNEFKEKLIDELDFENDQRFRKDVLRQIGRSENSFNTLEEYDNNLEEIENIISMLKSGNLKQQDEAYKKIEFYKQQIKEIQQQQQTIQYKIIKEIRIPKPIPNQTQKRNIDQLDKFKASGSSIDLYKQKGLQELLYFQTVF